jgi:hypothetical protein
MQVDLRKRYESSWAGCTINMSKFDFRPAQETLDAILF